MDIVLVRHAESIWNAEQRWQGQTDVPLSERGRAEAARLGARLAGHEFDRRLCSDLERARDTAAAIGGEFAPDRAWREMDLGAWGGLLFEEVRQRFPEEVAAMSSGAPLPIGGAESMPVFAARANAALDALVASGREGERVIVVTHGGVIRAILLRVLGVRGPRPLIGATNTSLTHLRVTRGYIRLVTYNCGGHLEPAPPHDDVVVEGAPDEIVRCTAAHLGLDGDPHDCFHLPAPRTVTRFARGSTHLALRSFATPALSTE